VPTVRPYWKGYPYLLIEDEELEAIEVESNHIIEIDSFVPRSQIDERFLDSPYYIGPNDPVGQEAFAVIREAMRGKAMVALGRVVLAKRERVIMLQPWEKGLMGTTLRYPYEVRDSKDYFYDIPDVKVAPDMLKLAEHILSSKEVTFEPTLFVDRYEQAVLQLLEKKRQGMPAATVRPFVAPTTVVNLMDALRRGIAEDAKAIGTPKKATTGPLQLTRQFRPVRFDPPPLASRCSHAPKELEFQGVVGDLLAQRPFQPYCRRPFQIVLNRAARHAKASSDLARAHALVVKAQ
jgi:Ku protein